jgi:hypothetical protein
MILTPCLGRFLANFIVDQPRLNVFHPPMKNLIRSQFILAFAVTVGLLLGACSGKHENTIVGKWKTSQNGKDATVTFTKDGKVTNEEGGQSEKGDYTLSASNTVVLKIETMSIEFGLAFASPDEMSLTPMMASGMPIPAGSAPAAKFTRVSR